MNVSAIPPGARRRPYGKRTALAMIAQWFLEQRYLNVT